MNDKSDKVYEIIYHLQSSISALVHNDVGIGCLVWLYQVITLVKEVNRALGSFLCVCLFVYLFIYLFVYLFMHPFMYFVDLFIYLLHFYLIIYWFIFIWLLSSLSKYFYIHMFYWFS